MRTPLLFACLALALPGCRYAADGETLAQLHNVRIEIKEAQIEGGLEKAIESYRQFLAVTPESAMTPEAIRRLADLKIEKEYGLTGSAPAQPATATQDTPVPPPSPAPAVVKRPAAAPSARPIPATRESQDDFEQRATAAQAKSAPGGAQDFTHPDVEDDLLRADAVEAIALYQKLLAKYPLYERNDQVLYQMARAYEELGEVEEAMKVMNRLVSDYPQSRYIDEVQFRRGEYFFTRKRYLDAEEAYATIENIGVGSSYYELALYKLGWSLYKQEMYEDALHKFIALLDHKLDSGIELANAADDIEKKRIDDTFRVVSFSFSYLGGPSATDEYFARYGARSYEENIYANLGEHYLEKRRYSDAALAYKSFVRLHPFHKASPSFDMRVIDIYKEGGFPKLVIEANRYFAKNYGLKSEYWKHFEVDAYPEVLGYLKTNLKELANHFHALYQDKRLVKDREVHYGEALTWYREYLESFPGDADSSPIHYQLADLLLEHKDYAQAALEYERTAYDYPPHEKASDAGYAAVYAHRQDMGARAQGDRIQARRNVIRTSLRFAEAFPSHEKAALVLGGAADDLYALKDYALAATTGRRLIETYPQAKPAIVRGAWLVVAHASFDLEQYADAELAYANVLQRTDQNDKSRGALYENLAASIYKQGEQAAATGDDATAAQHYLRIARHAPDSKIRPTAEFDAATALIRLQDWEQAAEVLLGFRRTFNSHELLPEVTKKIAFVYKEAGKLALAAREYKRIEAESRDEDVRRGALMLAAELHEQAGQPGEAVKVYKRYVSQFPRPLETMVEARYRLAAVYKSVSDTSAYHKELERIVSADARAGRERTERTRYLGAVSALALAEPSYTRLVEIELTKPFKKNLKRKQAAMKAALDRFGKLTQYQVGETTAAATFYMAEIYLHFSKALMASERPDNLSPLELEQYELAIEEQAYPFEEKAIDVHQKNLELLALGTFNAWIDKSLSKLAALVPARYAKPEEGSGYIESIGVYKYEIVRQGQSSSDEHARQADVATDEAAPVQATASKTGQPA
jgi:TolA-binding protein